MFFITEDFDTLVPESAGVSRRALVRGGLGTGLPVVRVASEIFGVHDDIADVARRSAKAGGAWFKTHAVA